MELRLFAGTEYQMVNLLERGQSGTVVLSPGIRVKLRRATCCYSTFCTLIRRVCPLSKYNISNQRSHHAIQIYAIISINDRSMSIFRQLRPRQTLTCKGQFLISVHASQATILLNAFAVDDTDKHHLLPWERQR